MPRINIHEHSETYSFQTRSASYGCVAFPIAAIWGPTYVEGDEDTNPDWVRFQSGYRGTTDFMQTFRGANNYLGAREKSFDYALKLLAAGYDILVKRVDGLGNKSQSSIFVVPAGVPQPTTATASMGLQPAGGSAQEYGDLLYRILLPYAVGTKLEWDYAFTGSDEISLGALIIHKKYNAETGKWNSKSGSNNLVVSAKAVNTDPNQALVVAFGKPTIITTQIKQTTRTVQDSTGTASGKGKKVTVTGTVPVSVYTKDGILLESRNVTVTETTEFLAYDAQYAHNADITVESVLAPDFTYIQIDEFPAILSLKVNYEDSYTNLFSSTEGDAKYGLFTVRLGSGWSATGQPEPSAEATVTATGVTEATVDAMMFGGAVSGTTGTYTFTYNGTAWKLGADADAPAVALSSYGIEIEGTPVASDKIEVAYTFGVSTDVILGAAGTAAQIYDATQQVRLQAKFPGTFGNNLKVRIRCGTDGNGYKIGTVEVFDNNGYNTNFNEIVPTDQLLELVSVAFDAEAATDNRPLITEAQFSNLDAPRFVVYNTGADVDPSAYPTGVRVVTLTYGTDFATQIGTGDAARAITAQDVKDIVAERFDTGSSFYAYISKIADAYQANDQDALIRLYNQQKMYSNFSECVGELTDPLVYDWDALIQGIADDQYVPKSYLETHGDTSGDPFYMEYEVSTLTTKMIEVAANSKCGAALIGTPFGMPRGIQTGTGATAVKTGALKYKDSVSQAVGPVYSTFGEVVGPWCKTTLALSGSNSWIAPEVAHLLLIINSKGIGGINKWWMVPAGMLGTGIVHSPEYKIKKNYLDLIQDHDQGVCLNPLMEVPGKGFTCFGNSTLWDKPLGSYNALQNLSTRFLTNRVKQRIWDTALQILFRYNNEDAYSHFYAGLSPLLDEMRSVGALVGNEYNPWGYRIIMNPDIVNLDRINANTVIGKVELAVAGVIDTVDVDLFLLPPTGFQETYD